MCGVDVQDQLCSYYFVQRRDHEWWHKILWRVLDQSSLNTFIIYTAAMIKRGTKPMDHLSFNMSIAYALTKSARKK